MKKKNESKMAAVLVSMGLCVVALGAGMTYYTWSNVKEPMTAEESPASPVTAAKSPTLDTAKAQREQMSNDDGEAPDPTPAQEAKTTETKTTSEQKTTEKSTAKAQQTAAVTYVYPVTGETVMPYSVDKAVYDPTLDQYRTNDTLCIAAEAGTEVKAAADGTVAEIKEDDESGRTLVVEHADGTRTTYGPLAAEGMVKKGDTVKQGQTVGKLDQPTKYQAALGSHLVFAMEVNGERVDPTPTSTPQYGEQYWRNKDKIFPINRKKAGGLALQGFRLSLFSREGICLLSCGGKTVPLVQFCQRKPAEGKKGQVFSVVFGAKVWLCVVVFQFFLQKNLYEFSERGYNGTKGEFFISRIGG